MVSPLILLVPIYGLVAKLHLLDTHAGLVLVYAAIQVPFTVVVLKSFFDGLPTSLFEAARLDGCSRFATFRLVALPLLGLAYFLVPKTNAQTRYLLTGSSTIAPISSGARA